MPESKALVGLSWEPKLPNLSSSTSKGFTMTHQNQPESSALWKPSSELVDGLFVPPNEPRKLNKLLRKQIKDTAGNNWFDMPAPTITPELQKDLQLLKLRNAIDPKRHYKKGESKTSKYFQVGTIIESPLDFFSGRLTNKERKASLADELLSDRTLVEYRKRKIREIEEKNQPGGNQKWKIKGKHTKKRAKQRRH
ncbi:Fcf2 pre-rRNA processing [Trema orientale]|uniref:Fcf2 pre-rRNA processing n=1 Tax=Trema orientale TaxID=63057 RepID=A0A2P5FZY3_TREOI|nr:Fcf2 pre-rRNA processing [Trema orientale]